MATKSPHPGRDVRRPIGDSAAGQRLAHPEALTVGHDDGGVMEQAVEQRHRGRVLGDEPGPTARTARWDAMLDASWSDLARTAR